MRHFFASICTDFLLFNLYVKWIFFDELPAINRIGMWVACGHRWRANHQYGRVRVYKIDAHRMPSANCLSTQHFSMCPSTNLQLEIFRYFIIVSLGKVWNRAEGHGSAVTRAREEGMIGTQWTPCDINRRPRWFQWHTQIRGPFKYRWRCARLLLWIRVTFKSHVHTEFYAMRMLRRSQSMSSGSCLWPVCGASANFNLSFSFFSCANIKWLKLENTHRPRYC